MSSGAARASPATELYIWYEAEPGQSDAVLRAFAQLQQVMGASARSRLLRRSDPVLREGAPQDTWMEIWVIAQLADPLEFQSRLLRAATESGLDALARSGRHIERFTDPSARAT